MNRRSNKSRQVGQVGEQTEALGWESGEMADLRSGDRSESPVVLWVWYLPRLSERRKRSEYFVR